MDNLINCSKCGSDACYVDEVNQDIKTYFCYGCGFQTNSLMKEGETFFENQLSVLPELYKDIKEIDAEGRVWYPISLNIPDKGTVFLNGKTAENTFWSAIKVVSLTEEEKQQPKYKNLQYKSDPKSLKEFGSDFIEACDYIGLFEK